MTEKTKLINPRLPRGFEDRTPGEIAAVGQMIETIRKVYERYGFDPVETPLFEYTETLGKFLPDTDRPNAGVFSLQDDDEQWMSLRYDLTAPLARYFAENFETLPKPYRSYRQGYVFRNEKPGPGRFRQFMQFDADTVGAPGAEADAEMCMMMADVMDALGLGGKYIVRVNNRKVLDGVLEAVGVESPEQKLSVLRAIDKMDKFSWPAIEMLLGAGRKDDSGDFTVGAKLSSNQIYDLKRFVDHSASVAAAYYPDAYRFVSSLRLLKSSTRRQKRASHSLARIWLWTRDFLSWRQCIGSLPLQATIPIASRSTHLSCVVLNIIPARSSRSN
jgi:histidyl-tRNA synthetase